MWYSSSFAIRFSLQKKNLHMYSHSMGSFNSVIYHVSSKYIIKMIICIYRGSKAVDGTPFRMHFSPCFLRHCFAVISYSCVSVRKVSYLMSSVFLFLLSVLIGIIYMNALNPPLCVVYLECTYNYQTIFQLWLCGSIFKSILVLPVDMHPHTHTFWVHGYLVFITYCASLIRPSHEVSKMS